MNRTLVALSILAITINLATSCADQSNSPHQQLVHVNAQLKALQGQRRSIQVRSGRRLKRKQAHLESKIAASSNTSASSAENVLAATTTVVAALAAAVTPCVAAPVLTPTPKISAPAAITATKKVAARVAAAHSAPAVSLSTATQPTTDPAHRVTIPTGTPEWIISAIYHDRNLLLSLPDDRTGRIPRPAPTANAIDLFDTNAIMFATLKPSLLPFYKAYKASLAAKGEAVSADMFNWSAFE